MRTLKEQLQAKTKAARTIDAILASIFKDMRFTAEQGGTFVSWREDEEYSPGITIVEVFNALNQELVKGNTGLLAALKDNQEQNRIRLERRARHPNPAIRNQSAPELRQWLVVSWES